MEKELGHKPDFEEVKLNLKNKFELVFDCPINLALFFPCSLNFGTGLPSRGM